MSHILLTEKQKLKCSFLDTITEQSGIFLSSPVINENNKGDGVLIVDDKGITQEHDIDLIINGRRGEPNNARFQYKDISDANPKSNLFGGFVNVNLDLPTNKDLITNGTKIKLTNLKVLLGGDQDSDKLYIKFNIHGATDHVNFTLRFETTGLKIYDNEAGAQVGSTLTHDLTEEHDFIIAVKDSTGEKISLYYRGINDSSWTSVFISQALINNVANNNNNIELFASTSEYNHELYCGNIILNIDSDDGFISGIPSTTNRKEAILNFQNIKENGLIINDINGSNGDFTDKYLYSQWMKDTIFNPIGIMNNAKCSTFKIDSDRIGILFLMANTYVGVGSLQPADKYLKTYIYFCIYNYSTDEYTNPILVNTVDINEPANARNMGYKTRCSLYVEDSRGINPGRIWVGMITSTSAGSTTNRSYFYYSDDDGDNWTNEIFNEVTPSSTYLYNMSFIIKNNYILMGSASNHSISGNRVYCSEWEIGVSSVWNNTISTITPAGNSANCAMTWKNSGDIATLYWAREQSGTTYLDALDLTESGGWSVSGSQYNVHSLANPTNGDPANMFFYNDLNLNIGFICVSNIRILAFTTRDNKSTWNVTSYIFKVDVLTSNFNFPCNNTAFINGMPICLFDVAYAHSTAMAEYETFKDLRYNIHNGLVINDYSINDIPDNESDNDETLYSINSFSLSSDYANIPFFENGTISGNPYTLFFDTNKNSEFTTRFSVSSNAPQSASNAPFVLVDNIEITFIGDILEIYNNNDRFEIFTTYQFSGCEIFTTSPSEIYKSINDNSLQRITFDATLNGDTWDKFFFNAFCLMGTNFYKVIIKADNTATPNWGAPAYSKTLYSYHPEKYNYTCGTVTDNFIRLTDIPDNRLYYYIGSYIYITNGADIDSVYQIVNADGYGFYLNDDVQTNGLLLGDIIHVFIDRFFGLVDNNFNEASIKKYRHLAIEIPAQHTTQGYYQIGKFICNMALQLSKARTIGYADSYTPNIIINKSLGGQSYPRKDGEVIFSTDIFFDKFRDEWEKEFRAFLEYIEYEFYNFAFINMPGTFTQQELNNFKLLRLSNDYSFVNRLGDDSLHDVKSLSLVEEK